MCNLQYMNKWIKILIVVTVVIFLPSCGREQQTKIKKITLLMWGGGFEKRQMDFWLEKFEESNSDIKVKCILASQRYNDKLLTMCAGGTPLM